MVTCDVEFAAPATQEFLNKGMLTVAPCIGTDQMGPKRFGAKGKLAFSFGNVAQDEGAAMAEWAYKQKGWRTADLATNNLLIYFKNIVQAFKSRFTQLGGKIVGEESYTSFQNDVGNAVSRLNGEKADVIVTSTSFGELPGIVYGLRSLGNNTPILNSWAGDGTYWTGDEPEGHELLRRHLRVDCRRRSEPGRQPAREAGEGRHRWLRDRRGGDRRDPRRAQEGGHDEGLGARGGDGEVQEGAHDLGQRQLLGQQYHSVFGRQYRVIEIQNNVLKRVGLVTASSPANIG